jgi:hypothetical protein
MSEHETCEELKSNQQTKPYTDGKLQQVSCCGQKLKDYRTYSVKSR